MTIPTIRQKEAEGEEGGGGGGKREGGKGGKGLGLTVPSVTVGSCLSLMVYVSGDTGQQATL